MRLSEIRAHKEMIPEKVFKTMNRVRLSDVVREHREDMENRETLGAEQYEQYRCARLNSFEGDFGLRIIKCAIREIDIKYSSKDGLTADDIGFIAQEILLRHGNYLLEDMYVFFVMVTCGDLKGKSEERGTLYKVTSSAIMEKLALYDSARMDEETRQERSDRKRVHEVSVPTISYEERKEIDAENELNKALAATENAHNYRDKWGEENLRLYQLYVQFDDKLAYEKYKRRIKNGWFNEFKEEWKRKQSESNVF